jgi:hypothetical protein
VLAKSAASDNHQSARPPRLIQIDAPFSSRLSRYTVWFNNIGGVVFPAILTNSGILG